MCSRRKRLEKKKDFAKPKFRVGKTQASTANSTNTVFKSKSIQLKRQIPLNLPTDEELKRQLSLLRHHSSTSRKEVITHLTNQIMNLTVASTFPYDELLTKFKPLVLDSSRKVRKSALELLKQIVLRQPSILILHQSSLVLFILSSMTHVDQAIRNDSVNFLGALITGPSYELSESIIRTNWAKVLRNFMQLMNWSIDKANSGTQAANFSVTTGTDTLTDDKNTKDQKERKLTQIKLLTRFIELGCLYGKRKEKEKLVAASTTTTTSLNNDDGNSENGEYKKEEEAIQIHAFSRAYIFQTASNPFRNLRLFNTFEIPKYSKTQSKFLKKSSTASSSSSVGSDSLINVDGLASDDLTNRRKTLIEIFYTGLIQGLTDLLDDEYRELKKVSQVLLNDLVEINADYELDSQK